MNVRVPRRTLPLLLVSVAVLILASCGGDDNEQTSRATAAEGAFLEAMVPHHESAVAMAKLAKRRAEHPQLAQLGNAIVSDQEREIAKMKRIHQRLFGEPLRPDENAHAELGLSVEEAGMMHGMDAVAMLDEEKPFDPAFIDEMVPHHQGAIRMTRAVLADDADEEITRLAESIVSAQSGEIAEMNRWRTAWYGAPSPAGGVPKQASEGSMDQSGGEMEHEGH